MKKAVIFILLFIMVGGVWIFERSRNVETNNTNNTGEESAYFEVIGEKEIKRYGHEEVLEEFRAEYSVGFKNKDNSRTIYYFASPIYYKDSSGEYQLIDTRICKLTDSEIKKNGYTYSVRDNDIRTYYSNQFESNAGVKLEKENTSFLIYPQAECDIGICEEKSNFIGETKKMISYKEKESGAVYQFYPSVLGTNCEVLLSKKELAAGTTFFLELVNEEKTIYPVKQNDNYISIMDDDGEIYGIFQKPIIKSKTGTILCDTNFEIDYSNGRYELKFTYPQIEPEEEGTAFFSFEMRKEKQADNALYSAYPDLTNNYLSNYIVLGKDEKYGTGRLMSRFDKYNNLDIGEAEIVNATYYLYDLTPKEGTVFSYRKIKEDWCSMRGNWNSKYKIGKEFASYDKNSPELVFDMTKELFSWKNNITLGERGGQLRLIKENDSHVLLSNDNTLYPNRMIIQLK